MEDLVARAIRAYIKWQKKQGGLIIQPGNGSYIDENEEIVLTNVNGELARYRYNEETDRLIPVKVK